MAKGIINGTIKFEGNSIVVTGKGDIMVDGDLVGRVAPDQRSISVIITEGSVGKIDCGGSVEVHNGNTGTIDCGGSVQVSGNVSGNIDCGGSVSVGGSIDGNIDAGGSVKIANR